MASLQHIETGYCQLCGQNSTFRFDSSMITAELREVWQLSDDLVDAFNRKESMFCEHCGSSLRIRRLCKVLIETVSITTGKSYPCFAALLADQDFQRLRIAEINACEALHSFLGGLPNLYYSEYRLDAEPGTVQQEVRNEDLQQLTYPDDYFDIILTSETIEHVPDPDKAWSEIYRTLKRGGHHIFTIPVIPSQTTTIRRAKHINGGRECLLPPAYHGSWGEDGMFVYTDFGMDVVDKLNKMGLNTEVFFLNPEDTLDVSVVFRSEKVPRPIVDREVFPMLEYTGERYLPWLENAQAGYEHLHRYIFARSFADGKRVLDLASGEGYGTALLADVAESVVGVDIDLQAIRHSSSRYLRANLKFLQGSILDIPLQGQSLFDLVVCFEAIEHIEAPEKLLSEVKRVLKKDGIFIVSTPNKLTFSDETGQMWEWHTREFYFPEFRDLVRRFFSHAEFLGQRVFCGSNVWSMEKLPAPDQVGTETVIEHPGREFQLSSSTTKTPLFFIALASDGNLRDIEKAIRVNRYLFDTSGILLKEKDRFEQWVKEKDGQLQTLHQQLTALHQDRETLANTFNQTRNHLEQLTREKDGQLQTLH
jgi:2-polyprenyl-3-methyl-5-hydroxy-6-metoxy-1,4-benzoquinol methylase